MADGGLGPGGAGVRPRKAAARLSHGLIKSICARLRAGELLADVCRLEGMPSRTSVYRWVKDNRKLAVRIEGARRAGALTARAAARARGGSGSHGRGTSPAPLEQSTFTWDVADEILERMGEGETLEVICDDPAMPSYSTVHRWRRAFPDFAEQFRIARETQAERVADMSWAAAMAVTPQTAYATHVKLTHMRWTAGTLAPHRFRARPAEPEKPPEPPTEFYLRHFKLEEREDGWTRVVAFRLIPETGAIERETPEQPWQPPPEGRWRTPAKGREAAPRPPDPEAEKWL